MDPQAKAPPMIGEPGPRGAAIVVMAKTPEAGASKTRLMPPLTAEQAAELALCFTQDTVQNVRSLEARLFLAYTPAGGRKILEPALPPGLLWLQQRGKDLGERMGHAIAQAYRCGAHPILLIGTDSPYLPAGNIALALDILLVNSADLVLGPAEDGGYYLLGINRPAPGLFDGVTWSTSRVYAETVSNAKRLNLRLRNVPLGYDIDSPADLARLREEIRADPCLRERVPMTARWLAAHEGLFSGPSIPNGKQACGSRSSFPR